MAYTADAVKFVNSVHFINSDQFMNSAHRPENKRKIWFSYRINTNDQMNFATDMSSFNRSVYISDEIQEVS